MHPETPAEGITLEELFKGRNVDIPAMLKKLKKVADGLGLAFGDRKMTCNSRMAQELGKWAETMGKGDEFHHAAFKAYFADGKNLAQREVLEGLAAEVGLSVTEAIAVLENRTYQEAVDADWALAHETGITAVPTFIFGERRLVGAQPYEALEKLMIGNDVPKRYG